MKNIKILLSIILFTLATTGYGQQIPFDDEQYRLQKHVQYLASDELEGRATGTEGEKKAAEYIIKEFEQLGLQPAGIDGSFLQPFKVNTGKQYGKLNGLKLNKETLMLDEDYYPLEYSSNGKVSGCLVDVGHGIVTPDASRNDYAGKEKLKGKIFIIETSSPESDNPHSEMAQFATLRHKVQVAEKKGAKGVIFVNSAADEEDPVSDFTKNIQPSSIPVVFASNAIKVKNLVNKKARINVDLIKESRTGHNVAGLLNNGAGEYIVIGGHYDHLGYGESGSRYMGIEKMIHNGADDNASGISVILELAKQLKAEGIKGYDILFLAFSGEEMGLLGSKYFVDNPTVDLSKVSYMINLDMVGMMKNRTLIVNGTGTSPAWGNLLVAASPGGWQIDLSTNESGIGPSDHTSFYLKDIPVLALFTGTHDAYHKPEDDWQNLNYLGMALISQFVTNLVLESEDDGKLAFTKTADKPQEGGRRKFNVTLGVMPSYSHQGPGLKIDGVSEGKPAEAGGLKAGDIILGMGTKEIKDIYDYMDALGSFKKEETTTIKVQRGDEVLDLSVTF